MIFDTMKPEFIRQLPVCGALCIVFLLACIRAGVQSNGQLSSKLKAGAYLSLAVVFATAFIGTTAPSQRYVEFLRGFLLYSCVASAVVCAAAALIYLRTKKTFLEPVIRYKEFLDDIDDFVYIFNSAGEQVLHNNPNGKEEPLQVNLKSLQDVACMFENACLTGDISGDTEQKITLNKRHYIVKASVIRDKRDTMAGVAIIFHDITEEQRLIDELEEKNILISNTNEELMQAIDIDGALFAQEEREKIAAEIRKELDVKMNKTLRFIDTLNFPAQENSPQKEQNLRSLAGQLRRMLADIRRIVYQTKEQEGVNKE